MSVEHVPSSANAYSEVGTDFSRVFNFADGVFSIAATLLAFDVKLPDVPAELHGEALASALWALWPKTAIYAQSFLVIGLYWMGHQRMLRAIKRYDVSWLFLNNLFLLCVAFLPVPSAVLGRFPGEAVAVRFYCGSLAACSLSMTLLWLYASRLHRLVDVALSGTEVWINTSRALLVGAVALLSALVAEFSPHGAVMLLFGYVVLSFPLGYLVRLRLARG